MTRMMMTYIYYKKTNDSDNDDININKQTNVSDDTDIRINKKTKDQMMLMI